MSRIPLLVALIALLGSQTAAFAQSTSQRLDLLERRVARITDLTLQLDELRRENRTLRGETEQLRHEIEQLKRKQRDIYLDIDQRLGAGSAGQLSGSTMDPATATAATSDAGSVAASAPVATSTADRQQIEAEYQAAYALLDPKQKRYDEAATAFAAFVAKYPGDSLAANAQYWLGEAYYVSQKNAEALAAFQVVVDQHPGSDKAAGALFKIGRLQQAGGQRNAARDSYRKVLTDYPNSSAAGLARQRLEQLGG
jgi:tol-pal system protein YbgF